MDEGTGKLCEMRSKIAGWKQSECIEKTVESYVDYLRHSCYGTRSHAYVETILETKGRPGPVLGLDIANLALANEEVRIEIPDIHLVAATGLVNTRTVKVSDHLKQVLKEYIEYHRDSVIGQELPLFTTSHGRAAPSTIRRSLNKGYGKIPDQIANSESEPTTSMTSLSPENVWKYAMTSIIE
jgi:integrase